MKRNQQSPKVDWFYKTTSNYRKYYLLSLFICLGIVLISCFGFAFFDELKGAGLVYFVVLISFTSLTIILFSALFPYIQKKNIEFFVNRFSYKNLNNALPYIEETIQLEQQHYEKLKESGEWEEEIETLGQDIFTEEGFYLGKDVWLVETYLNRKEEERRIPYDNLTFSAIYTCHNADTLYDVEILISEKETRIAKLSFNPWLYYYLKKYNIHVEQLDNVLSNCEENIREFLKTLKSKTK